MNWGIAAALSVVLSAPTAATAGMFGRDVEPYVGARVGFEDGNANQFRFGHGVMGGISGGLEIGDHWRSELTVARRSTPITEIPPIAADGHFSNWSIMLNGYYHITRHDSKVSPFIGFGVGYTTSKLYAITESSNPLLNGWEYLPQRHTMFGVQGMGGFSFQATERLSVELMAVYFTTGDRDYRSTFPNNPTVEAAYRTSSGQVGIRWRF